MALLKHFFPTSRTTKLEQAVQSIKDRLFKKKSNGDRLFLWSDSHTDCFYNFSFPTVEEEIAELRRDINLILKYLTVEVVHQQKDEYTIRGKRKK